jgi:hypothetical protein
MVLITHFLRLPLVVFVMCCLQALSKLSQASEADADGSKAEKRSAPDAVAAAAAAGIRKEALACCLQVRCVGAAMRLVFCAESCIVAMHRMRVLVALLQSLPPYMWCLLKPPAAHNAVWWAW